MSHPAKATLLLTLALAGSSLHAAPSQRLTAYPRVAINAGVVIEAFIPRDPANRHMRLELDGPVFRAFEEDMDGDKARVLYTLRVDQLPDGEYPITLVVARMNLPPRYTRTSVCRGAGCLSGVD